MCFSLFLISNTKIIEKNETSKFFGGFLRNNNYYFIFILSTSLTIVYYNSLKNITFLFSPVGFTNFAFRPSASSHFIETDL